MRCENIACVNIESINEVWHVQFVEKVVLNKIVSHKEITYVKIHYGSKNIKSST